MREGLTMWDNIALAACVVGLCLAGWFVIQYQRMTRGAWRGNPFGRFLMTRKLLLCALFANAILNRLWEPWPTEITGAILLWLFALHTILPYRFLVEAQQERAEQEKEGLR